MREQTVALGRDVFRDLAFSPEESQSLRARSSLMITLSQVIEQQHLTQAKAAELFGVSQPRISDLVRGKIDRFSVDTLVDMLGRAGLTVQIVVEHRSRVA
jgi:predicted XRE-type DNA-binding protein